MNPIRNYLMYIKWPTKSVWTRNMILERTFFTFGEWAYCHDNNLVFILDFLERNIFLQERNEYGMSQFLWERWPRLSSFFSLVSWDFGAKFRTVWIWNQIVEAGSEWILFLTTIKSKLVWQWSCHTPCSNKENTRK